MRRATTKMLGIVSGLALGAVYAVAPAPTAQAMIRPAGVAVADTATGCLQKGSKTGVYKFVEKNGKTVDVMSSSINLSGHVGHMMTLTTSAMPMGSDSTMMSVTKMAMVSPSCS
jgi:hypothetical protein